MGENQPYLNHLISGTSAGVVSTVALYPLELLKIRYQAQISEQAPYKSLYDGIRTIVRTEGWQSLYQGMSLSLVGAGIAWGGYFFFYEKAKARYKLRLEHATKLSSSDHLLAACEAGSIIVFLTNPIWLVKTRLQVQVKHSGALAPHHYTGPMDAFKTIMKSDGIFGFYQGLTPALVLVGHGAVQFAIYEKLKDWTKNYLPWTEETSSKKDIQASMNGTSIMIAKHLSTGSLAKMCASLVTYPIQVVKTRLQLRGTERNSFSKQTKYKNTIDCIIKIAKEEGPRGYFKGCLINALRGAPSAAITFLVYEECMNLLKIDRDIKL